MKYKLLARQNLSQFSYPDKTNVLVKLYFQKDEKAVLSEGMIVSDQNIHSQLTRVCDLDRMRLLSPIWNLLNSVSSQYVLLINCSEGIRRWTKSILIVLRICNTLWLTIIFKSKTTLKPLEDLDFADDLTLDRPEDKPE